MEKLINSDMNASPTMLATKTFNNIIEQVQTSSLNFHLQISPFSAVISIKKSLIKDRFGNVILPPPRHASSENIAVILEKNVQLENELDDLTKKYELAIVDYENAHKLLKSAEKHQQEVKVKVEKASSDNENLLKAEIENLKSEIKDRDNEIVYLQKSRKAAEEVSKKLNRTVQENKVSFENEKRQLINEHKAEVKSWKRELGKVNSKVVKLEKLKETANASEDPTVNQSLKPEPIHSDFDILTLSSLCDAADDNLEDCKPGSDDNTVASAWPSSTLRGSSRPSSPLSDPISDSPLLTCSENQIGVENHSLENKKVKRKSLLSEEVQEVLRNDKFDFAKLVEAVRNNPLPSDLLEIDDEEIDNYSNYNYEEYPDEYRSFYDATDEEIENDDTAYKCSN